jgi:hypothetical protein
MRIVVIALLASSLVSPSLFAASPEKTAKIEKLFDILKVSRISDEIVQQLTTQVDRVGQQIATQAGIPLEERAKATEEVRGKMAAAMKDLTSWERLKPGMIDVYDKIYSDADLDGVLAFFTSTVGQHYLDNSVNVVMKSREMAGAHVKEAGDAVQALAIAWLKDHGVNPPAAGAQGGAPAPAAAAPPK